MAGADMTEVKLTATNKNAALIHKFIKELRIMVENRPILREHLVTDTGWTGKSMTVLMENQNSQKLINYKFKTDVRDSPTKRLISLKGIHVDASPAGPRSPPSPQPRTKSA